MQLVGGETARFTFGANKDDVLILQAVGFGYILTPLALRVNSIYPVFVHRCGWLLPPAASTSYLEAPFKAAGGRAEHAAGEREREGGKAHIEAERKSVRTQNREEKRTDRSAEGGRAGGEERRD